MLCFFSYIKGPKTGFQVGFTVGLGFAITENFLYLIMSYSAGGFTALFLTSLIRGIGSIPGHAVWTSFSGAALGWWLSNHNNKAKIIFFTKKFSTKSMDIIESIGIDVDMDGDISGFDGPEYTMLTALDDAQNPNNSIRWKVSEDNSEQIFTSLIDSKNLNLWKLSEPRTPKDENKLVNVSNINNKIKIIPPKSIIAGLFIAIFGHALWNGSETILSEFGKSIGLNEDVIILLSLLWIFFLVITVILISFLLMRGINTISDTDYS